MTQQGDWRRMIAATAGILLLASCSSAPAPTPPDPAPTLTKKESEQALYQAMVDCLDSRGWEVTLKVDNSISAIVPPEQQEQYDADVAGCQDLVGWPDVSTMAPYTDEQLAELYEYEKQNAACLEEFGYTFDIPSPQVYIDRYRNGSPWSAFSAHFPYAQAEYEKLMTACPPAVDQFRWAG